jgi:hypothetical protein
MILFQVSPVISTTRKAQERTQLIVSQTIIFLFRTKRMLCLGTVVLLGAHKALDKLAYLHNQLI